MAMNVFNPVSRQARPTLHMVSIRLSDEDHATLKALGNTYWLRAVLQQARDAGRVKLGRTRQGGIVARAVVE